MSRAKNQAKADGAAKGAAGVRCSKPYVAVSRRTRHARGVLNRMLTSCFNSDTGHGNRQPAEAEPGRADAQGACWAHCASGSRHGRCVLRAPALRRSALTPCALPRCTAQCKICLQPFICTSSEAKLKEHSDSKHPKAAFADCFPDFTPKK